MYEVRPAALFSDHMVLQAGVPVPIWGTAEPGERVKVEFLGQTGSATTAANGRWMLRAAQAEARRAL